MGTPSRLYAGNLTDDLLDRLAAAPDHPALRRLDPTDGSWVDVSTAQFHREVTAAAKGLVATGVGVGDRVAIMSATRYEWTVLDYAIWWAGAITVPVYETSSTAQVEFILADSGCVHAFVGSTEQSRKAHEARSGAPGLRSVRPIEDVLDALAAEGREVTDETLEERRSAVTSDSIATLIYTSGTTGRPKGCELTHGNFRAELGGAVEVLPELFDRTDSSTLLFLPLAHVFARIIQVGTIRAGATLGHTADINGLVDHLQTYRPTFILAVPRVFEKVFNSASATAWADGKGKIFDAAARTAIAHSRARDVGRGPGPALRAKHALYDRLVYRRLRALLGGRVDFAISGGAPLGDRLGHFYRGIGINVLEGYGLTETTAALTVNHATAQRIGSVGLPLPDVEVRVAEDGELQFRGPQVFIGYWNGESGATGQLPTSARSPLDADGWFGTGDLGEVDDDGFVRITGRKKEVIITAGGKNVSPAVLEDRLRAHPYIGQCLVVGDGKPFIAAMVTVDRDHWQGDLDARELHDAIAEAVDDANSQVSRAEAIRKFVVLPDEWDETNGYLTPSFKVKRFAVLRDYHDTIERIYAR